MLKHVIWRKCDPGLTMTTFSHDKYMGKKEEKKEQYMDQTVNYITYYITLKC